MRKYEKPEIIVADIETQPVMVSTSLQQVETTSEPLVTERRGQWGNLWGE